MNPIIDAAALVLGKQSRDISRVLYFGGEIVLPRTCCVPFFQYDVFTAAEGADYRKKYGADYQSEVGYAGIRKALEGADFSQLKEPERLGEVLDIHPRLLGQLLSPDVYVVVEPEALAGGLISGEVYELVRHRIEAVPAREILRQYLLRLLTELEEEDDIACRRENGCDQVDLAELGWTKKEAARQLIYLTEEELAGMPPQTEFWSDDDSPEEEWEE
jgi:hypothetical protein